MSIKLVTNIVKLKKNRCDIGLKQFRFNNAKANTDKIGPQYINMPLPKN